MASSDYWPAFDPSTGDSIAPAQPELLWTLHGGKQGVRCELRALNDALGWEVRIVRAGRLIHSVRLLGKRAALRWAVDSRRRFAAAWHGLLPTAPPLLTGMSAPDSPERDILDLLVRETAAGAGLHTELGRLAFLRRMVHEAADIDDHADREWLTERTLRYLTEALRAE